MKKKRFIITEKDFKRYGIKSHYDLSVMLDKNFVVSENPNTKQEKKSPSKTVLKGVSTIGGDMTGRIMEGYASTFDKDRANDVVTLSAMTEAVDDLVKQGSNTVFYDHDTSLPIGRVLETKLDEIGLFIKVMISKSEDVDKFWIKIKEKILNAFSIRLRPKRVEVVQNEETGRIEKYNILSMELFEVSVVGIPCNPHAAVTSVVEKSFKHSIWKLNHKKQGEKMNKNAKSPKTKTKAAPATKEKTAPAASTAPAGISKQEVVDMLKQNNEALMKSIGELMKPVKPVKAKKADKVKSAKTKPVAKTKENTELKNLFAGLNSTIADLGKKLAKGQRKGFTPDNAGAGDSSIPKKVLKSATDADTVKFVIYASNNEEVYKALSVDDKHKVKGLYIQLADAATAGD